MNFVDSPFQSIYQLEGQENVVDPEAEELANFLAELQDDKSNDAVVELVNEAADLYESQFQGEIRGRNANLMDAERALEEHIAPLCRDVERLLEAVDEDFEASI